MRVQFRRLIEADLPKNPAHEPGFSPGICRSRSRATLFAKILQIWFFAALWEETVIGFTYGYALPRLNGSKKYALSP